MDISSQEIEAIVKQVLAGMGGAQTSAAPAAYTAAPGGAAGDRGVFENVDDAVEAAWKAQRDWAANYKIEDRQPPLCPRTCGGVVPQDRGRDRHGPL